MVRKCPVRRFCRKKQGCQGVHRCVDLRQCVGTAEGDRLLRVIDDKEARWFVAGVRQDPEGLGRDLDRLLAAGVTVVRAAAVPDRFIPMEGTFYFFFCK